MKTAALFFGFLLALVLIPSAAALNIGDEAPGFSLGSQTGKEVSLKDYKGKVVIVEWFNPGCPFSRNHYESRNFPDLQSEYGRKGVVWLTVSSTNPEHKDYFDESKARKLYEEWKFASSALLVDPTGETGRAYGAKTTPHIFVIDSEGKLVYRGAADDVADPRADPKKAKSYIRAALDDVLAGRPVAEPDTKPYGCSVKYRD